MSAARQVRYVRIEVDPSLPVGKVRVGGVRIAEASEESLWRELHTTVVAAGDESTAWVVREGVRLDPDLELDERGSDA